MIVEADRTFTGKPKPFLFEENKARFSRWADKIIYVKVDDMPEVTESAWEREYHQRDAILRGLETADANDIILISDVDEIPHVPNILTQLDDSEACHLRQQLFCFYLNYRMPRDWKRAIATRKRHIAQPISKMRKARPAKGIGDTRSPNKNCGWHFSYLMDAEAISKKFAAFSHREYDNAQTNNLSHIELARAGKAQLLYSDKDTRSQYYWVAPDPIVLKHVSPGLEGFILPRPTGLDGLRNLKTRLHGYLKRKRFLR